MGHLKSSVEVVHWNNSSQTPGCLANISVLGAGKDFANTELLFSMNPPCSISIADILLQLAVSMVTLARGLLSPRLHSGAVIYQERPNALHRAFTNPPSLAWLASFCLACPLETLLASTANTICLLRFWGDLFWDGSLSCCEELLHLQFLCWAVLWSL